MATNESVAKVVAYNCDIGSRSGAIFIFGREETMLTQELYYLYEEACVNAEWNKSLNISHPVFVEIEGKVMVKGFFVFLKCRARDRMDYYCEVLDMFRYFKVETLKYLLTCGVPVEAYRSAWQEVYPTVVLPTVTVPLLGVEVTLDGTVQEAQSSSGSENESEDGLEVGM